MPAPLNLEFEKSKTNHGNPRLLHALQIGRWFGICSHFEILKPGRANKVGNIFLPANALNWPPGCFVKVSPPPLFEET